MGGEPSLFMPQGIRSEERSYLGGFLRKGLAGTVGTLFSVGVVAMIYPERGQPPEDFSSVFDIKSTSGDLFKHAFGGGVIATAVGSLTEPKYGLYLGVGAGLFKEAKDYFDGDPSSHAQPSDFFVTGFGAFASYILQDFVDADVKVTPSEVSIKFDF